MLIFKDIFTDSFEFNVELKFQGKSFSDVSSIVYNEFQGIIFGIELEVGGLAIIRLNPGTYIIPNTFENNVYVYMICEDKKVNIYVNIYFNVIWAKNIEHV